MIDNKTILAIVPARGGSKGIYRKNLREIAGKSLIVRSIETARQVHLIDRLVVDTDDDEIATIASSVGAEVPFLRPAALATDTASIVDCVIHLLVRIDAGFNYVLVLQCTSPLRTSEDIYGAIVLCASRRAPACVSVSIAGKPPQWMLKLNGDGRVAPLMGWDGFHKRRQDLDLVYLPNGAVFMAEVAWFREHRTFFSPRTIAYVMPPERACDIDSEEDMRRVEESLRRPVATN